MLAILGLVLCLTGWSGSVADEKMVGGGINMDISITPYMVSIHLDDPAKKNNPAQVLWDPICVGTIFTALYVVTACHCVVGEDAAGNVYPLVDAFPLDKWAFLAGAWDLRIPEYTRNPATQRRSPMLIRYHPKCHPERTPWLRNNVPINDVAVAKMSLPFEVNNNVKPANIFSFDRIQFKKRLDEVVNDKIHTRCSVSGWGSTWEAPISDAVNNTATTDSPVANRTSAFSDEDRYKLKYLETQARYEADCLDALVRAIKKSVGPGAFKDWDAFEATFRETLKNQVCAANKNASPCRGDSGSGLVCDNHYLIGVNSFGLGCGSSAPDVYQSVLPILDWLQEVVCPVQTCVDFNHLHRDCDTKANKAFIENCLPATTEKPSSHVPPRHADTATSLSAGTIVNPHWLVMLIVNFT